MSDCFNSSRDQEQSECVSTDTLTVLSDDLRFIFTGVFVVITVASLIGNLMAVYAISQRKYRCIQKTCIISLALSDTLSTVVIAVNNFETFSHKLLVWTLGGFLCSFIPMCQMAGILASSIALMFIAMDRYRNIIHALSKKWNPSLNICVTTAGILWLTSFGVSYPMYNFFAQEPITIVFVTEDEQFSFEDAQVCVSFEKDSMRVYYIVMVVIIFLPLLVVFVWSYYNIAYLVWKHRKPGSEAYNKENTENSTSNTKTMDTVVKDLTKKRDVRVERKIRTFKIIVTLMIVFIVCRLPYFTVFIVKLSITTEEELMWILNYTFVALHIVNCSLNPLLYTFLNQTLRVYIKTKRVIRDFTWEICCFCFAKSEFEEFEKENPFARDCEKSSKNSKVKFQQNVEQIKY